MVFDEMMNPYDLIAEMIAHISHLDAFFYYKLYGQRESGHSLSETLFRWKSIVAWKT